MPWLKQSLRLPIHTVIRAKTKRNTSDQSPNKSKQVWEEVSQKHQHLDNNVKDCCIPSLSAYEVFNVSLTCTFTAMWSKETFRVVYLSRMWSGTSLQCSAWKWRMQLNAKLTCHDLWPHRHRHLAGCIHTGVNVTLGINKSPLTCYSDWKSKLTCHVTLLNSVD